MGICVNTVLTFCAKIIIHTLLRSVIQAMCSAVALLSSLHGYQLQLWLVELMHQSILSRCDLNSFMNPFIASWPATAVRQSTMVTPLQVIGRVTYMPRSSLPAGVALRQISPQPLLQPAGDVFTCTTSRHYSCLRLCRNCAYLVA